MCDVWLSGGGCGDCDGSQEEGQMVKSRREEIKERDRGTRVERPWR